MADFLIIFTAVSNLRAMGIAVAGELRGFPELSEKLLRGLLTAISAGVEEAGLAVVLAAVTQLDTLRVAVTAVRERGGLATPPTAGGGGAAEEGEVVTTVSRLLAGGVAVAVRPCPSTQPRAAS